MLNVLGCRLTYQGEAETNAEARFSIALRPRKPEGSLGRTAQDGHLDSHTAPELCSNSDEVMLNVLGCQMTYQGQTETNAEAWFNIALRPRKPEGSLGRTAQEGHLDSHTAPELCVTVTCCSPFVVHALSNEAGAGQFMTDFLPLMAWSQVPPVSLSVSLCA